MKDSLESAANFGQALAVVRQKFFEVRHGEMAHFADACTELVGQVGNPFAIPALFGYAARGRMHDIANWTTTDQRNFSPTARLLSDLAALLEMPRAIECRRNYYWGLVDGLAKYIAGDIDGAWMRFALTAQSGEITHVFQNDDMAGGVPFARCFPNASALQRPRSRHFARRPAMIRPPSRERRLTFMVSVDPIYADAFAPVWIETLSRLPTADAGFHIHLMANEALHGASIERLVARCAAAAIDVSVSLDATSEKDRAYFTCSRFLSAAQVMDAVGSPLLICDADLAVSDPNAMAEQALPLLSPERGCRAIINAEHGHGYLPWRHVSASLVFVGNDPVGRAYVETACRFIEYFWDDAMNSNWWIDQLALESARQYLRREGAADETCLRINDRVRRLFVTPPKHKSDRLATVPEVRTLMAAGNNLHRALDILARRTAA